MSKLIINTVDGTVTTFADSLILDINDLSPEELRLLDEGNDSDAIELAIRYGNQLTPETLQKTIALVAARLGEHQAEFSDMTLLLWDQFMQSAHRDIHSAPAPAGE